MMDNYASRLAWLGIFALIGKIRREVTADNGFHDLTLDNDIIRREREFVVKGAIKFYNMEIEQPTFEALIRYYYAIVSQESYKIWEYRREQMVYSMLDRQEAAAYMEEQPYVFVAYDEPLPMKEIEWLTDRLASWKYHDKLTDNLSVSMDTRFNDWKGWQ